MERFRCEPFGIVTVTRRRGARNIRIRIRPGMLLVSADYNTSDEDIISLLRKNQDSILEKQNSLESKRELIDEDFRLENKYFSLDIKRDEGLKRYLLALKTDFNSVPNRFTLRCSSRADFNDEAIQERLMTAVNHVIRNTAREPLTKRVMQLADEFGFEVNSVRVKIEKSKWGSCSAKKNINLSAYLILLPDRMTDFVITHELCHLKEMNHGPRFHALVNRYTGGKESELDKELKGYSINIFDYTVKAEV